MSKLKLNSKNFKEVVEQYTEFVSSDFIKDRVNKIFKTARDAGETEGELDEFYIDSEHITCYWSWTCRGSHDSGYDCFPTSLILDRNEEEYFRNKKQLKENVERIRAEITEKELDEKAYREYLALKERFKDNDPHGA